MDDYAIYLRVSTNFQRDYGYSIEYQSDTILKYIEKDNLCDEKYNILNYIDNGYSGKNLKRPAMKSLINDLKQKKLINYIF